MGGRRLVGRVRRSIYALRLQLPLCCAPRKSNNELYGWILVCGPGRLRLVWPAPTRRRGTRGGEGGT
eukprot:7535542-Pyramimonas_sp.AAC.1